MVTFSNLAIFTLLGNAFALPKMPSTKLPYTATCGELNVFQTGFTAYHPYVAAQGFPLDEIDKSLRHGAADLVKAGFNVHVVFQGPEQPVSNLADRMKGKHWDFTSIGFGIRGYRNGTATKRFEDIMFMFHDKTPTTPTVYNWGGPTFVEPFIRRVNFTEDCADKPGKLIAYEEICDPSICNKTTNVFDGDLSKLTYDE